MYERLLDTLKESKTDVAMCGYRRVYPNGQIVIDNCNGKKSILSAEDILKGMCVTPGHQEFITWFVWDKLYKRSVWSGLRFDIGLQTGEDRWAMFCLFSQGYSAGMCNSPLYNYRSCNGLSSSLNVNHDNDVLIGNRILEASESFSMDRTPFIETYAVHMLGHLRRMAYANNWRMYRETLRAFRSKYHLVQKIYSRKYIQWKFKLIIWTVIHFPCLVWCAIRIHNKVR